MGRISRRNSVLQQKIEFLSNTLKPFIQYPRGPIHPAFPGTVMAYHLLTEDELDSMAHFYHQSTPGPYMHCYPSTMNWDKDFLARTPTDAQSNPSHEPNATTTSQKTSAHQQREPWLVDLLTKAAHQVTASQAATFPCLANTVLTNSPTTLHHTQTFSRRLSKTHRLRIKRRKFGKFIGFRSMNTPTEEIFGRVQASLDRAVERSRAEMRRTEEVMTGRKKVG